MSIELNRFMTGTERQKVEDVLMKASERNIRNEYGFYSLSGKQPCGLDLYTDRNETELVNAILQKAVDRMPRPRDGAQGEHYLLRLCKCQKCPESGIGGENHQIECSDYLGNGICRGRLYHYEDDLPFI